ncbi:DUF1622 domain-containing protein [Sinomonas halotolerans]|uniref:DUF1622 domain-containing protein n=1 Tax=Sinomonas halotolerans TaxID=1644133 RepID=A0ABU9WYP1_9MICC
MEYKPIVEAAGQFLDLAGVAAIVVGAVVATAAVVLRWAKGERGSLYGRFRRQLGRSVLLGLELLVGADIVRTVAVTPTFDTVIVLGLIVIIRTFLSFSLELEITGRWPWQKRAAPVADAVADGAEPA